MCLYFLCLFLMCLPLLTNQQARAKRHHNRPGRRCGTIPGATCISMSCSTSPPPSRSAQYSRLCSAGPSGRSAMEKVLAGTTRATPDTSLGSFWLRPRLSSSPEVSRAMIRFHRWRAEVRMPSARSAPVVVAGATDALQAVLQKTGVTILRSARSDRPGDPRRSNLQVTAASKFAGTELPVGPHAAYHGRRGRRHGERLTPSRRPGAFACAAPTPRPSPPTPRPPRSAFG